MLLKINPPVFMASSQKGIGLLVLHVSICLVSVIRAWVSIDFTLAEFNSCRQSEGPRSCLLVIQTATGRSVVADGTP